MSLKLFCLFIPAASGRGLLGSYLYNSLYAFGGDIAISGMGIINSLGMLFILPVIGIRQGVQPIISFNYGARKPERVRQAILQAIVFGTATLLIGFAIIRLFPDPLIRLFNREPELLAFTRPALQSWFLLLPLVAFQIMASSYFQAIGKAGIATFLTLTRQVIFLIPALLIFPLFGGLTALLYAAPFADFFSALVTGLFFTLSLRQLQRQPLNV